MWKWTKQQQLSERLTRITAGSWTGKNSSSSQGWYDYRLRFTRFWLRFGDWYDYGISGCGWWWFWYGFDYDETCSIQEWTAFLLFQAAPSQPCFPWHSRQSLPWDSLFNHHQNHHDHHHHHDQHHTTPWYLSISAGPFQSAGLFVVESNILAF